ncbi:hypothetical protein J5N97_021937 [Dioscorea zingiberensis]|uniref:Uncharacterized protein n=1 Tax=Dioscorea zingiberensis TaxID=325984 RepID=A0A9D5HAE0_9LILI|nr:hypothetical protein J5N97_021937 [Dioscorea zingiberensis]
MQVDELKEDKGRFGAWMTKGYSRRGRTQNFSRRSSGDEVGRKTMGTRFEVLQNVSEEQAANTLEHVSNGRLAEVTGHNHVSTRTHTKDSGRGGKGARPRGNFQRNEKETDSFEGQLDDTRGNLELKSTQGKVDRYVASRATRGGRGGYNHTYHCGTVRANQYLLDYSIEKQMEGPHDDTEVSPPLRLMTSLNRENYENKNEPNNELSIIPSSSQKSHFAFVNDFAGALEGNGNERQKRDELMEMEEPPDPGEGMDVEAIPEDRTETSGKRNSMEHYHHPKKGRIEQEETHQGQTGL